MGGFQAAPLLDPTQQQQVSSALTPVDPNAGQPGSTTASLENVASQRPSYDDIQGRMQSYAQENQPDPQEQVKQQTLQLAPQIYQSQMPTGKGLKGMLQRFAYGFGQAAMHEAGLATDPELQAQAVQQAHMQAQTQLVQQQIQQAKTMTPVQFPNGTIGYYPLAIAAKLQGQIVGADARTGAAQIGADSRETVAGLNNQMKAAGLGYVAEPDASGKISLRPMTKEEQSGVIQAKSAGKPNEIQLIARAQNGDKEAQKMLDTLQSRKIQLAGATGMARGKGFGYYRSQYYYDPELGQNVPMFAGDAMQAIADGKKLVPSGPIPASTLIGLQRLNSEATPAIKGVQDNLKAFDNAGDRAVFARVMKDNPMSEGQDPHTWVGNILDQSLKGGLSPQGQQLAIKLNRLNETVSLLRSTLGLPASNGATALTLKLLPGSSTPNSQYAGKQLDELKQVVEQSNVRALGGSAGGEGNKPSGSVAFRDGAKVYTIPQNQVAEFRKDHPNAVKQ